MTRITGLLLVPWGVEVLSAGALVLAAPAGTARVVALLGVLLVVLIVGLTGLGAAPIHGRLVERFDEAELGRLLRVDRLRVLAWTARLVVAAALVGLV